MIFKFRYRHTGGHVHVRVFASSDGHNFAKSGDLAFRPEEWRDLHWLLDHVAQRLDLRVHVVDDTLAQPKFTLPLDGPDFT